MSEELGSEATMSEATISIELILRSPAQMRRFAARLAKNLARGDILLLCGRLGAGKTALVKGLAKGLGIEETVTSPTFVILRTYPSANASSGVPGLDHIDLYRLGRDDVEALGIQEVLEGENIIAIEWPEVIIPMVLNVNDRSRVIMIDLDVTGRSERAATLRVHDTRKNVMKGLENFRP